jgi:hypothetical protein
VSDPDLDRLLNELLKKVTEARLLVLLLLRELEAIRRELA